jgi:hypothetical protein
MQSQSSRSKKQTAEIQKPPSALKKQSIQEDLNAITGMGASGITVN